MEPKKLLKKTLIFQKQSIDEEKYIIRGVFSTGAVDRQDEIVDQNGWNLDEFMANPVILFAHDHYQPAVGKCIELTKDGNGNLVGAIQFAAEEYDFAMTLFKLYAGEFMRAFSVSFQNNIYEIDQEKDTVILRENTLFEISCVNVPANAMALAYSKGIDCDSIKKFMKHKGKRVDTQKDEVENAIETISKSNKETICTAIEALTGALKAYGADIKVVSKVEHPEKTGGAKKIPVSLLNRAVRELLALKKVNN
jgi:phage head maturation protease